MHLRTVTSLVVSLMILGGWVVPAAADWNHSPVIGPLTDVVVGVDGLAELTDTVTDENIGQQPTLTATSSAPAIATVAVDGYTLTVTGQALGQATITVTADDGYDTTTTTFGVTVAPDWALSAVSAGDQHTCGLQVNGTADCWGDNAYNQVSNTPAAPFLVVSAGWYHTCGTHTDGTVECWGANWYNQVGGTPATATFRAVSAGGQHSCGTHTDGTVECWGWDTDGQGSVPANLAAASFLSVSTGGGCTTVDCGPIAR